MGYINTAIKNSPAGQAWASAKGLLGSVTSAFGKKPPDRNASLRLRKIFRQAKQGDPNAIAALNLMATRQGSKFKNINRKAVKYANLVAGGQPPMRAGTTQTYGVEAWVDSGGPAPTAGRIRQAVTRRGSASAAPRAQRPCAYGPRGADGYCPKRTSTRSLTSAGGRPCKYGARIDGRCPPKPRKSTYQTRAERVVSSAVSRGARKVTPGMVGTAVGFIAKTALVGAAGYAAYWLTSKLQKLRYKTYDDLRYDAANWYREARRAAALDAGRGLTPAESAQLSQWFKAKMRLLDNYEASGQRVSGVANLTFRD